MSASVNPLADCLPSDQPDDYTVISKSQAALDWLETQRDQSLANYQDARLQLVSCFERKAVSVTVRGKNPDYRGESSDSEERLKSKYRPSCEDSKENLNTVHEICQAVYDVLRLDENRDVHGFLIVSGTTNSLKTQLALGLIHFYLEARMREWLASGKKLRKPHLVTCEDHIEKYFFKLDDLKLLANAHPVDPKNCPSQIQWLTSPDRPDYTPRHKTKDLKDEALATAVDSALRMTPAVFYAGEIRNPKDWKSLYRLAQSHLVVLTTHASGLVNTFEILRDRLKAKSPAQHSELAESVFAVVHTRTGPPLEALPMGNGAGASKQPIKSIIPTCWLNTPMSVSSFTSDGLASLVGKYSDLTWRYRTPKRHPVQLPYAVGRRTFAELLLGLAKGELEFQGRGAPPQPRSIKVALSSESEKRFVRETTAWDLRGE
ncbi:MAG: hypothetical protein JO340_12075 [Acidobacteriaceae bacterium]|nr:hypothetical protein [Acidobacteriaceae bacterium]